MELNTLNTVTDQWTSPFPIADESAKECVRDFTASANYFVNALKEGYGLSLTKTTSSHSIKQGHKTTVTITIENTGTTTLSDIEVVDSLPADFDFVSGEKSNKYGMLKPGESRTFQYTIQSREAGKFDLGQATATYADEEGNYHTVKSNSAMVEVMAPLVTPEVPTGEEKGIPGFEAIFAIAGLLVVAYLLRRRE
ncbi:MAG: DUF11 domain-containing protein [Methanophagales archaeon]|nr:DUF11 domain-containing protein [Methanophagales archaeon]